MISTVSIRAAELHKYGELWTQVPEYRETCCGSAFVDFAIKAARLKPGASIVDVGCGTGRAGVQFAAAGMRVLLVDGCPDALDAEACDLPFMEACLWDNWPGLTPRRDLAFCSDVLEHIPEPFTMLVVARCLDMADVVFLHIATVGDNFGALLETPLHVTVKPFAWWRDHLAELGTLTDARDLMTSALFVLERR